MQLHGHHRFYRGQTSMLLHPETQTTEHFATNTNAYKYSFFPHTIPLRNSVLTTAVTATSPEAKYMPCLSLEPFATITNVFPFYIVFIFVFLAFLAT